MWGFLDFEVLVFLVYNSVFSHVGLSFNVDNFLEDNEYFLKFYFEK